MSTHESTASEPSRFEQARAFTERYYRQLTRNKGSMLFLVGWPALWYFLFSRLFLNGGALDESMLSVVKASYAISFGMFGAFTVALNGFTTSFLGDIESKRYRKFRSLPIYPAADLAGRFASGFVLCCISYLSLLVIGYLDGAAFSIRGPLSIPVVVLSLFAFCAIGIIGALCLSTLVDSPQMATTVAMILLLLAFFVTGLNGIQANVFPGPTWVLNYLPNTLVTRIQLYHFVDVDQGISNFDVGALPTSPTFLGLLVVYTVGLAGLGTLIMHKFVYGGSVGE